MEAREMAFGQMKRHERAVCRKHSCPKDAERASLMITSFVITSFVITSFVITSFVITSESQPTLSSESSSDSPSGDSMRPTDDFSGLRFDVETRPSRMSFDFVFIA